MNAIQRQNLIEQIQKRQTQFRSLPVKEQKKIIVCYFNKISTLLEESSTQIGEDGLTILFNFLISSLLPQRNDPVVLKRLQEHINELQAMISMDIPKSQDIQ